MDGLAKNTNASSVLHAQKEMKEKQREDAAKKREKDREDRYECFGKILINRN